MKDGCIVEEGEALHLYTGAAMLVMDFLVIRHTALAVKYIAGGRSVRRMLSGKSVL